MRKIDIAFDEMLPETLGVLCNEGLLPVGRKKNGTANVMTIGWATNSEYPLTSTFANYAAWARQSNRKFLNRGGSF